MALAVSLTQDENTTKIMRSGERSCARNAWNVPESGATCGLTIGLELGHGFGPGRGLKYNPQRSLHTVTNKQQNMFAGVQKHVVASLPRTSCCFVIRRFPSSAKVGASELQKCPKLVSLSGNVQQSVVRLFSSEQSLSIFTDTEQQSKRRLLASGTQVH